MNKQTSGLVALVAILAFFLNVLKVVGIVLGVVAAAALVVFLIQLLIEDIYYHSHRFLSLKEELSANTEKCNELNDHIIELQSIYTEYSSIDYGHSLYSDNSVRNYRRPLHNELHNNTKNEYFCSLSVCKNAQTQPFKYLCKYFGIERDEDTLAKFEKMFNNISAAEEGKSILQQERNDILEKYKQSIPFTIRQFSKNRFFKKLGYKPLDLLNAEYPHYTFKYVSAGGNSGMTCGIVLDLDNLERFVSYLYTQVQSKKTARYQRTLMTGQLRERIKLRDNYTCQKCGISVDQEPHLLLEIDHILPISKGGLTIERNLQTLCWRCNRQKGSHIS